MSIMLRLKGWRILGQTPNKNTVLAVKAMLNKEGIAYRQDYKSILPLGTYARGRLSIWTPYVIANEVLRYRIYTQKTDICKAKLLLGQLGAKM